MSYVSQILQIQLTQQGVPMICSLFWRIINQSEPDTIPQPAVMTMQLMIQRTLLINYKPNLHNCVQTLTRLSVIQSEPLKTGHLIIGFKWFHVQYSLAETALFSVPVISWYYNDSMIIVNQFTILCFTTRLTLLQ